MTLPCWRISTAFSIHPESSSAGHPLLAAGESVDDRVPEGGEGDYDGVTGGLVLGAALAAGGQSAAVTQT